ncbi:MAG: hypothetical protein ACE5KZ_00165 [Candidatus Scalinduaceae bacterium]
MADLTLLKPEEAERNALAVTRGMIGGVIEAVALRIDKIKELDASGLSRAAQLLEKVACNNCCNGST